MTFNDHVEEMGSGGMTSRKGILGRWSPGFPPVLLVLWSRGWLVRGKGLSLANSVDLVLHGVSKGDWKSLFLSLPPEVSLKILLGC